MKNQKNFDIIVVGGGIAGVSAALSAARLGKRVALIEKSALLGGLAVSGLINWFEPLCDGNGNQVIYSQTEELLKLAIKYGHKTLDEDWLDKHKGTGRYSTWFDHNLFSLSLLKLLVDNNVKIYFETTVCEAIVSNNLITSIVAFNASGKIRLTATNFIDSSGSAYLCRISGLETLKGKNFLTYVTTTLNQNNEPVMQYSGASLDGTNHPKDCRYFVGNTTDDINEYLVKGQLMALNEFETGKIKKIISIPSQSQFRKICCLKGEYVLSNNDECVHFADSIGCAGVFNKIGKWYEIPLRSLYSKKIQNLLVCGRIISSIDDAWEATRVIPVCCLTGEAAGILATTKFLNYDEYLEIANKRNIKIHY